jgi:hypothetical protein
MRVRGGCVAGHCAGFSIEEMVMNSTFLLLLLAITVPTATALFNLFNKPASSGSPAALKARILAQATKTQRGLTETAEEKEEMAKMFAELEQKNKVKKSLSSPLVNAVWYLQYTTSDTILGRGGSPRVGPILQTIDAPNGFAQNSETVRYLGFLDVPRAVTAAITPMTESKCAVQFQQFTIGPLKIKCPPSFKGELDVTYLDEDLRLSRGDKGNIFVLTRYADLP